MPARDDTRKSSCQWSDGSIAEQPSPLHVHARAGDAAAQSNGPLRVGSARFLRRAFALRSSLDRHRHAHAVSRCVCLEVVVAFVHLDATAAVHKLQHTRQNRLARVRQLRRSALRCEDATATRSDSNLSSEPSVRNALRRAIHIAHLIDDSVHVIVPAKHRLSFARLSDQMETAWRRCCEGSLAPKVPADVGIGRVRNLDSRRVEDHLDVVTASPLGKVERRRVKDFSLRRPRVFATVHLCERADVAAKHAARSVLPQPEGVSSLVWKDTCRRHTTHARREKHRTLATQPTSSIPIRMQ